MTSDKEVSFAEATLAYYRRFRNLPPQSPDGGPGAEAIMHAALTGISLEDDGDLPEGDFEDGQ